VIKIPRYTGREIDGEAKTELDHYANCPVCGALVDLRDLAAVMDHAHGQEIEIEEAADERLQ
jgi:predicted protein tyrosine phosphatase